MEVEEHAAPGHGDGEPDGDRDRQVAPAAAQRAADDQSRCRVERCRGRRVAARKRRPEVAASGVSEGRTRPTRSLTPVVISSIPASTTRRNGPHQRLRCRTRSSGEHDGEHDDDLDVAELGDHPACREAAFGGCSPTRRPTGRPAASTRNDRTRNASTPRRSRRRARRRPRGVSRKPVATVRSSRRARSARNRRCGRIASPTSRATSRWAGPARRATRWTSGHEQATNATPEPRRSARKGRRSRRQRFARCRGFHSRDEKHRRPAGAAQRPSPETRAAMTTTNGCTMSQTTAQAHRRAAPSGGDLASRSSTGNPAGSAAGSRVSAAGTPYGPSSSAS